MKESVRTIVYRFVWPDGREKAFTVKLRAPAMTLDRAEPADPPEWTRLGFHQCPNCPLKEADTPRCPVAVSLIDLIDLFKDCLSTEVVDAIIEVPERRYSKRIAMQDGLSALMGIYMASSGCPILDKMRPMLYTHLPFASVGETFYRSISTYLVAQLLRERRGLPADWKVEQLAKLFEQVNEVNRAFIHRLRSLNLQDASLNALVRLDCLAGYSHFTLSRDQLKNLEAAFSSYLEE